MFIWFCLYPKGESIRYHVICFHIYCSSTSCLTNSCISYTYWSCMKFLLHFFKNQESELPKSLMWAWYTLWCIFQFIAFSTSCLQNAYIFQHMIIDVLMPYYVHSLINSLNTYIRCTLTSSICFHCIKITLCIKISCTV